MKERLLLDFHTAPARRQLTIPPGGRLNYFFAHYGPAAKDRSLTFFLSRDSSLEVHGIVLANDATHNAIRLTVVHAGPRAHSRVSIKAVVGGRATSLIDGTIRIEKSGKGADARLEERALLLSPTAHADTKPHLEIKAHEVKASHAATVGRPSEEELFYLETRGIPRDHALRLLVEGFLSSELMHLPAGSKRAKLETVMKRILHTLSV